MENFLEMGGKIAVIFLSLTVILPSLIVAILISIQRVRAPKDTLPPISKEEAARQGVHFPTPSDWADDFGKEFSRVRGATGFLARFFRARES